MGDDDDDEVYDGNVDEMIEVDQEVPEVGAEVEVEADVTDWAYWDM